ncbi:hypothetical protein REISMN_06950 [Rickettsia tamurae subsp. buchneri]|uniref:Uncharacterized protein n=1 Tax=Rickettsia tamurae subsp. buchneri TaxID=1462938 RepID=A0A8E0WKQ9_9RICK|nr:hypothetical protein REISMN_07870 [Rickettsia tamurae subsp. buchneri]KDO02447.1 hypothetical protein REISMN_06950 [Rickettsia tamurae subsp. buchneri]
MQDPVVVATRDDNGTAQRQVFSRKMAIKELIQLI